MPGLVEVTMCLVCGRAPVGAHRVCVACEDLEHEAAIAVLFLEEDCDLELLRCERCATLLDPVSLDCRFCVGRSTPLTAGGLAI